AAFLAGWVDAVVGGGGLVLLPALLLVPGMVPVHAAATNKLAASLGTAVSAVTYARRVPREDRADPGTVVPMALSAGLGAALGAAGAASLPGDVFVPVVLVALVTVGLYTASQPTMGQVTALRHSGGRHVWTAVATGGVIGVYDGLIGPGTGSFLVFALVGLVGYSFLASSATAKIVNLVTNLSALTLFALHGSVLWQLGLALGVVNVLGGYLGARTAISRGSGFVRVVFLVVVTVLILRLGWQQGERWW
ncbi:MAG: TSUP family transporter, partial [Solirubrobacteraceae bacterium]|nr:TSUP family transporter [Solirubrobacteraceae bacterium]